MRTIFTLIFLLGCLTTFFAQEKQKGFHLYNAWGKGGDCLEDLIEVGANWITLFPYGAQKNYNSSNLASAADHEDTSSWDEDRIALIHKAKALNLKVMLKPHLWLNNSSDGKWREDILPENWVSWSNDYERFILHYARLAEETGVDLFCIGMELTSIVKHHPAFWRQLIQKVRKVYSGKLTYAANWYEEYEMIDFWDELDYIGIQAYFPLGKKENPSIKYLERAWQSYVQELFQISKEFNKPILFTELGYKSTSDTAISPWDWAEKEDANYQASEQAQAKAYQAFFKVFWDEKWFAGVQFWQWRSELKSDHAITFSPQEKLAETILKEWWK